LIRATTKPGHHQVASVRPVRLCICSVHVFFPLFCCHAMAVWCKVRGLL